MNRDCSALIAGAGIGGLATAIALRQIGAGVKVVDRRPLLSEEGAGLQLGPNAVAALRRLGVADRLAPLAHAPDHIAVRDGTSGALLKELPLGAWIAARHGAPYWTVHRVDLHTALRDAAAAAGAEIATSCDVREVVPLPSGVAVQTGIGDRLTADVLVGADGLWSTVRRCLFDVSAPRATGLFAARATIPRTGVPAALASDSVGVWVMPDAHCVHYPVRGGREINIVVILKGALGSADHWSQPLASEELMAAARSFAAPLRALLSSVPAWLRWPLLARDPLPSYARSHAALIGDAAHPTFPFFAQGAAMAIEDAEALAATIRRSRGALAEALRSYDRERRPHTQDLVRAATENGRIYHLDGPLRLARNAALAVIPASILMSRYDWIYRDKR